MHTVDGAEPDPGTAANTAAAQPNPEPPGRQELPLRFVGSGSEYFRIWIVNLLLTLVTLGLYYPFAKVRRLRYFHGATEVGGHAMSFHANPWTMFRGYVLVAVLLITYTVAGQFSPMAGAIAFGMLALLWPALWHSSQRFRLANTGWRGLRFQYTGTRAQAYAVMGVPIAATLVFVVLAALFVPDAPPQEQAAAAQPSGWLALLPLLLMLGLGPLFLWLLKRQQHRHYALGAQHTQFNVGAGAFYGLSFKTLGVTALLVLALGAVAVGLVFLVGTVAGAIFGKGDAESAGGTSMVLTALVGLVFYLLLFAVAGGYYTARLQNLVWNGTHTSHLRWSSQLGAGELVGLWFINALLTLLTLGLYFPFAQVNSARLRLEAVKVSSTMDIEQLVAEGAPTDESAAGDAAGDLFGFDVGL
jgi:uncharacterized membrane protein YjgN (DUF898 family)